MTSDTLQTISNIFILVGFILAALGGFGAYHFSKKVEKEKEHTAAVRESELTSKITSLVEGNQTLQERLSPFEQLAKKFYPNVDQVSALQRMQEDFERLRTKTEALEKKTNIVSYLELRITLDELTPPAAVSDKETSAGIQNAIALFDVNNIRYRFVTDFQFSFQQVSPTLRRGFLLYKPEDPRQLLGRPIDLLNRMKDFVCNYSDFVSYMGFNRSNQRNRITLVSYVNGIEIPLFTDLELQPGQLYAGQLAFPLAQVFSDFTAKYAKALQERTR
jgi:hypothetical protein